LSDDELMDHLLTKSGLTIDTSILTDSERKDLIKSFKERALDVPGIIHFIFEKKMLVELEAQDKLDAEAQARYEAEFMELLDAEEEFQRKKDRKKKRATSTSTNLDALTAGTLEFQEEDAKGKLKTVSVKIGKALGRFISIYQPKIFKQEAEAFAKSVRDFKREVTAEKKRISDNIKFSENEVLATKELVDLFFKLERKGMLVPVIATEINKKLLEVKNPYRIRIINKKGYKPIGTIYSIEHGTKAQLKGTLALPSVKKENKIIENKLVTEEKDVLSTEEEPRTPEEIDFFSTEEGQKMIEDEFKYLEEYYNSKLFTIETGSYTGPIEDLTETERIIYNRAVAEELYEKEEAPKKEPKRDLFMEGLAEKTEQDKAEQELNVLVNAFIKENVKEEPQKAYETHPLQKEFVSKIKNGPMATSLAYAVGVYQYVSQQSSKFSDKQIATIESILVDDKLSKGFYTNEISKEDVLMKDGARYKIMSATKNTISVFNVETSNLENLDILNFLSNIKDVVAEEVPVKKESFETKPSTKKGKIIKDALQNVFSNFDTSVAADLFVEDSIIETLKTQCK